VVEQTQSGPWAWRPPRQRPGELWGAAGGPPPSHESAAGGLDNSDRLTAGLTVALAA
jgi:hypothetical protein